MSKAKISVIIPTYNREETIKRSIASVLNQSYNDFELIIIDDCSTDNTKEIIQSFSDKRIIYKKLDRNMGGNYARNTGIKMAKGDYIAFQDSDDEWLPNKLKAQLKEIEETKADYCFCRFTKYKNNKTAVSPIKSFVMPDTEKEMFRLLFNGNQISTQTLLVHKKVFQDLAFDERLPRFQDWDFAIRMAESKKGTFAEEPLVNIYEQGDSISKNNKKALKAFELMEQKYENYFDKDKSLEYSFKKAECKILWHIGENPRKIAREILRTKFDLKIFGVLVLSTFGIKGSGR